MTQIKLNMKHLLLLCFIFASTTILLAETDKTAISPLLNETESTEKNKVRYNHSHHEESIKITPSSISTVIKNSLLVYILSKILYVIVHQWVTRCSKMEVIRVVRVISDIPAVNGSLAAREWRYFIQNIVIYLLECNYTCNIV